MTLVVTLAIALAPIGSAWAAPAPASKAAASVTSDCESMARAAGNAQCPCCDQDTACAPDACIVKCVQLLGVIHETQAAPLIGALETTAVEPLRPPDRSHAPPAPPPRA